MEHLMHLQQAPFEAIVSGKKKVELRLYDSTRRKLQVGDTIVFDYEGKQIKTIITELNQAKNFEELYNQLQLDSSIYGTSEDMLNYYNTEKQNELGVIGIGIELVYKVGIDIGGTNVRCAIFNTMHELVKSYKFPNDRAKTAAQNLEAVVAFINQYKVESIGIGAPGPLDARLGKILNPPNLFGWDNFEIVNYFEENCHVPTKMTNDANAAALAEAILGNGQGYESMYYITMSTGFGGGFVFRGELINGISTSVGEIYNMIVNEDPHHHGGTNAGSLNEQCGGYGLSILASEAYGREVGTKELFELADQGEDLAKSIIDKAIDAAAKGIANIGCVIDPDIYVVGGSIAIYHPDYVKAIFTKAKQYYIKPEYCKYVHAKFGDDAGLIGASLL